MKAPRSASGAAILTTAQAIKTELPALSDVVGVDVAEPAEVDVAFPRSIAALGGLDVMICNAGISIRRDFLDIDRADFDRSCG